MRDRGYPLDDVDDRADLLAADHAELGGHYRALFVGLLAEPHGRHEQVDLTNRDRTRHAPPA